MKATKNPHTISASAISGTTVINTTTETVGTIEDLMIDLNNGEVLYAVLSVDTGFMNLGSKYFAVPLEEFELRPEEREAMLNVSKERLEKAPGFDKDKWPSGPQEEFITEVNTFYDREPRRKQTRDAALHGRATTGGTDDLRTTEDNMRGESVADKSHMASTDVNKNMR